jgi:proline racemase
MRFSRMITAIDAHAAGEPGRVITGGIVDVPGKSMLEKMLYLQAHSDHLRRLMLNEPRGYPAANCNLILPPTHPDADAGYIIMEHTEYPGMSGTNTICLATVLLETGMLPIHEPTTEITLESPAGLIHVQADCKDGKVTQVTFKNVPSFAVYLDETVDVPQIGKIKVDVAYGGMFYVIAEASQVGIELVPEAGRSIVRTAEMIRNAANEQLSVIHPLVPEFNGITISQLSGPATHPDADLKNAVVVATSTFDWQKPATWTGVLDRSPCGTGTCAKMAALYARGKLALQQEFRHEGLLGTLFTGKLLEETRVGAYPAVIPTISGEAWITGFSQYVLDPTDPFPEGFKLGDIW